MRPTTGFSPETAQSSSGGMQSVISALEQVQHVQFQAGIAAASHGDERAMRNMQESIKEAEAVKRNVMKSGSKALSKSSIKEVSSLVPQWAPELFKSAIAREVPMAEAIKESARVNMQAAQRGERMVVPYPTGATALMAQKSSADHFRPGDAAQRDRPRGGAASNHSTESARLQELRVQQKRAEEARAKAEAKAAAAEQHRIEEEIREQEQIELRSQKSRFEQDIPTPPFDLAEL